MCFPGRVNVENATAAITVALYVGVTPEEIREALPLFKGVSRRFDVHAKSGRLIYIDDYVIIRGRLRRLFLLFGRCGRIRG